MSRPSTAETARDTLGGAVAAAEELPSALATEVLEIARSAFTSSLQVSAFASAVLAAVAAVLSVILLRDVRMGSKTERPVEIEPGRAQVPAAELE